MDVGNIVWVAAFFAGVAALLSPCFFPLVPPFVAYLCGTEHPGRWRILIHAVSFVAGFTIVFAIYGGGLGLLGDTIQPNLKVLRIISGAMFVVFGMLLLGVHERIPKLMELLRERKLTFSRLEKVRPTPLTSFGVGIVFAIAWTPCTGPILGSVLTEAYHMGDPLKSSLLMASYALGVAVPFIVFALAFDWLGGTFTFIKKITPVFQKLSGMILVALGILLVTDTLAKILLYFE